jgi:hypothetical protein
MLKIIIFIVGYILNNFTTYQNIIVDDGKKYNLQIKKNEFFFKRKIIYFVNVETDLRLYYMLAYSLQINVGEGLELGVRTRYFHIRNMAFSGGGQAKT